MYSFIFQCSKYKTIQNVVVVSFVVSLVVLVVVLEVFFLCLYSHLVFVSWREDWLSRTFDNYICSCHYAPFFGLYLIFSLLAQYLCLYLSINYISIYLSSYIISRSIGRTAYIILNTEFQNCTNFSCFFNNYFFCWQCQSLLQFNMSYLNINSVDRDQQHNKRKIKTSKLKKKTFTSSQLCFRVLSIVTSYALNTFEIRKDSFVEKVQKIIGYTYLI